MSASSRTAALLACLVLPVAAAQGQVFENVRGYAALGLGWTVPLGQVTSITDVVKFSSPVPANDLYRSGLAVHLVVGGRAPAWLFEISIDARLAPLTDTGQAYVNQTRTDGREVDVEYATFELFAGRVLPLGGGTSEHLSLFGGVGIGLAVVQLSAGSGVEPYNDEGFGGSAKAGLEWVPSAEGRLAFRLAGRYQLFSGAWTSRTTPSCTSWP